MIKINGVESEFTGSVTVAELLKKLDCKQLNVAVECSGEIIKRCDFGTKLINDGDVIEIVKFVGGG